MEVSSVFSLGKMLHTSRCPAPSRGMGLSAGPAVQTGMFSGGGSPLLSQRFCLLCRHVPALPMPKLSFCSGGWQERPV